MLRGQPVPLKCLAWIFPDAEPLVEQLAQKCHRRAVVLVPSETRRRLLKSRDVEAALICAVGQVELRVGWLGGFSWGRGGRLRRARRGVARRRGRNSREPE